MKKKIAWLIIIICCVLLILLILLNGVVKSEKRFCMCTIVEITIRAPYWCDFSQAFSKAFTAIKEIEIMANKYNPDSELAKVNLSASKQEVVISDDLYYLIEKSLEVSENTSGTFDITVAPLVALWKDAMLKNEVPSKFVIEKIKDIVGYNNIVLNKTTKTVFYKKEGVEIDLSSIAKGYAVDKAVSALQIFGIRSAIVNAGGEIYCLGKRNLLMKWRVGIADPHKKRPYTKILFLKDQAAATSGGYEQYYTFGGKHYSHIIDPETGYAIEDIFSSITVVFSNCMLADAIATALSVKSGEEQIKNLKQHYNCVKIYKLSN